MKSRKKERREGRTGRKGGREEREKGGEGLRHGCLGDGRPCVPVPAQFTAEKLSFPK